MKTIQHFSKILRKSTAIATILTLLCVSVVLAASGDLDTTFSGDGKIKMDIKAGTYNYAWNIAIQADGEIVTVGNVNATETSSKVGLIRYTETGALDKTFNGTGKKIFSFGNVINHGYNVVIEPSSGKVIVVGQTCNADSTICDGAVARLNKNGSFDTGFNSTGIRTDDFGGGDNGSGGVAVQPDGKIVAGGYMYNTTTSNYDFAVYRYNSNGTLDTTFNKTGKKSIPFGTGRNDYSEGVAIQADGKIIILGKTCDSSDENCNFALVRLNKNGSLDTTFKSTGKVTTDFGGSDSGRGLAIQADGKIIAVGKKVTATGDFVLARYNKNGTLDTTFAGTGKKVLDFSGSIDYDSAKSVVIQESDGKIVVSGYCNGDFALARFTIKGNLDSTFNSDGKLTIDFGGDDAAIGLAIQEADGKYVLAGSSNDGTLGHWALTRVLP